MKNKTMIINLPNGKSVEVPLEVYLRMTDEDFEYLMSVNWGDELLNPFESSVLLYGEAKKDPDEEDDIVEENTDPTDLDKLQDLDAENFDE
jgi:hypothetical protein